jgi:hypothetical protein
MLVGVLSASNNAVFDIALDEENVDSLLVIFIHCFISAIALIAGVLVVSPQE